MTIFLKLLRYFFGSIFFAYGFVCLLGGPEPELRGSIESYIAAFIGFTGSFLFFAPELIEIINQNKRSFPDIMNTFKPYIQKNCSNCGEIVDARASVCLSCGEQLNNK